MNTYAPSQLWLLGVIACCGCILWTPYTTWARPAYRPHVSTLKHTHPNILRALTSSSIHRRKKAILWLRQHPSTAAQKLLLWGTYHPHNLTRYWAYSVLRAYGSSSVQGLFKRGLRDPFEAIRLLAVLGLHTNKRWNVLVRHTWDTSIFVRELRCRMLTYAPVRLARLVWKGCLSDPHLFVRMGIAEALRKQVHLSTWTRLKIRHILHRRERSVALKSHHPLDQIPASFWKQKKRQFQRNMRAFKSAEQQTYAWLEPRRARCLARLRVWLQREYTSFIRKLQEHRKRLRTTPGYPDRHTRIRELILRSKMSELLGQKRQSCIYPLSQEIGQRKLLDAFERAILLHRQKPFFRLYARSFYLQIGLHASMDTAYDLQRNDIRPLFPLYLGVLPAPKLEHYTGGMIRLFWDERFNQQWSLKVFNHWLGQIQIHTLHRSHWDNDLQLQLRYATQNSKNALSWYLEERLVYTQSSALSDALLERFIGPIVIQHARTAFTFEQYTEARTKGLFFHTMFQSQLHMPQISTQLQRSWSPYAQHRAIVQFEGFWRWIRSGVHAEWTTQHTWLPSQRNPVTQVRVGWLLAIGHLQPNTRSSFYAESLIGYSSTWRHSLALLTPSFSSSQQAQHRPFVQLYVRGHLLAHVLQWSVKLQHGLQESFRPPFLYAVRDALSGVLHIGRPQSLRHIAPRSAAFRIQLDALRHEWGAVYNTTTTQSQMHWTREIAVMLRIQYPLWKGLQVHLSHRWSAIHSTFVPIQGSDGTRKQTHFRNYTFVQLSYIWMGGRSSI